MKVLTATLFLAGRKAKPKKVFDGLSFVVLGPNQTNLNNLEIEWAKKLAELRKKGKAKIVEFLDEAVQTFRALWF